MYRNVSLYEYQENNYIYVYRLTNVGQLARFDLNCGSQLQRRYSRFVVCFLYIQCGRSSLLVNQPGRSICLMFIRLRVFSTLSVETRHPRNAAYQMLFSLNVSCFQLSLDPCLYIPIVSRCNAVTK